MPRMCVARLEEAELLHQALVAELLAVVGGDHDHGVVPHAALAQVLPHPAELGVDLADHPEVLRLQAAPSPPGRSARRPPGSPSNMSCSGWRRAGIGARRRAVGGVVHRGEPRRPRRTAGAGAGTRRARTTARPGGRSTSSSASVRNVDTECSAGRSLSLASSASAMRPGRGRRDRVAELAQPRPPTARGRSVELEHRVEPGQHALPHRQPRVVGPGGEAGIATLVGVAEQRRRVAGAAGHAGDVVEAVVERRAVGDDAIVHLVRAGVERGPPGAHGAAWA